MIIFGSDREPDRFPQRWAHLCDRCKYVTFLDPNEDGEYICKRCGKEEE